MYRATRRSVTISLLAMLAACGSTKSRFKTYNGPPVTQVVVNKGKRRMYLLNNQTVLKSYDIGLGNEPIGTKQFEGDGKTPEGVYFIDRFNPRSAYHLSVGVSYPNERDTAFAEALGQKPGGDIFIHGWGPEGNALAPKKRDWTAGCIAVKDEEIEDVYAMLRPGVPIVIYP
ncbi:L,D-transpeptidase family protein [Paracoccus sp. R12_1]|uniref:L,D-transpeptidase family protein n=1 Tax=unclassified Paracoccus (in: a-proteobacteria) TaxID=2688777 RepID=UPI001AD9CA89|nr:MULTISPECIES: L,D-transpeptidase family protein [unclassified Paracoccus (in: a-proteobacteria)]MBO9456657.1 L,D-transpeptidase family protein [Paracoccus sp. R12_2]MBO9487753.1 L,D-transpeptidase family protein [Paracoccus sp. R12_1]